MTIPASSLVNVLPGVLAPASTGQSMNGLVLTENLLMPTGQVLSFTSAAAVSDFFGPSSAEFTYASIYFAGYVNSTETPSAILFAPYNASARAAWIQSGSLASMTLAELQALTGVLSLTFAGTEETSSTITLSGATSFSDAATLIQAGFTAPAFAVSWDAVQSAFVFTSTATGATETVTYASGTLSASLNLTQATGAILSQGAAQDTPASALGNAVAASQNWASVSYITEPTLTTKEAFAAWLGSQNNQYLGVIWDSDAQASVADATEPFGVVAIAGKYNGVMAIGGDPAAGNLSVLNLNIAAFVQGMIASINFNQPNGRITLAAKSAAASAAVLPSCLNPQTYANLLANGYSTYGSFASASQGFVLFENGNMPGEFPFADQFVNQVWLRSQLQAALLNLMTQTNSIPYDPTGYGLIRASLVSQGTGSSPNNGPINAALSNGVIQSGVALSASEAAAVNQSAGVSNAAQSVTNNGFFLQVLDPGAAARAARQTPIINLWYADGGSVQMISLNSFAVL